MSIDFNKNNGLVPVIVQDNKTKEVLMLGYMNQEALAQTKATKKVTFYSRSKERLWTKGESSGNFLILKKLLIDCDQDTLLILAKPQGPTCHKGSISCFGTEREGSYIAILEQRLSERIEAGDSASYTVSLINKGIAKIAQKVGEEAVELVIEAMSDSEELFLAEAADLMYHYLLLLKSKGLSLEDVEAVLKQRAG